MRSEVQGTLRVVDAATDSLVPPLTSAQPREPVQAPGHCQVPKVPPVVAFLH